MMKRRNLKNAAFIALEIVGIASAVLVGVRARAQERRENKTVMTSTIAFVSTRHNPKGHLLLDSQIYLMNGDGSNMRHVTENKYADNFPALSPDGRKIVFDSNRFRTGDKLSNTSHLFLMNADGMGETQMTNTPGLNGFPDWGEVRDRTNHVRGFFSVNSFFAKFT